VIALPELSLCLAPPHTSPYSNNALALGLYLTLRLLLWKVRRRVKRGPWFIYYIKLLEMMVRLLLLVCEILHCMFVEFIMVLLNKYAWVLCWTCNLLKYTYLWIMVCSSILPSPLWNIIVHFETIMKYIIVSKDIWLVCQVDFTNLLVHFAKMLSPHYSIVKYMLLCPHSQGSNSTLSTRQHCKLSSPCGLPQMSFNLPTIKKILGCQMSDIFLICPKSCPKRIKLPLD
jgi:hypothetical protein